MQPNVFSSFYRRFFNELYFSLSLLHRRVKSRICLENLETCSRSPENIRLPCSALNHTRSLFPDFQIVSESEKTGVSTKRSSQIFEKNWKFRIFGFLDVWIYFGVKIPRIFRCLEAKSVTQNIRLLGASQVVQDP